ncbi:Na+/H+ antiporter subunit C, partial [Alphaproteobacteria bacterium]|nr:Na+/H+ antiporter subunit C [Alphaproteobacteria bacterium]
VVGVATNALGLALVVRIQEAFHSIEENKLLALKKFSEQEDRQL